MNEKLLLLLEPIINFIKNNYKIIFALISIISVIDILNYFEKIEFSLIPFKFFKFEIVTFLFIIIFSLERLFIFIKSFLLIKIKKKNKEKLNEEERIKLIEKIKKLNEKQIKLLIDIQYEIMSQAPKSSIYDDDLNCLIKLDLISITGQSNPVFRPGSSIVS